MVTEGSHQHLVPLMMKRSYTSNREANLAALRVVLDLPRKPISLKEEVQPT